MGLDTIWMNPSFHDESFPQGVPPDALPGCRGDRIFVIVTDATLW